MALSPYIVSGLALATLPSKQGLKLPIAPRIIIGPIFSRYTSIKTRIETENQKVTSSPAALALATLPSKQGLKPTGTGLLVSPVGSLATLPSKQGLKHLR